MLSNAGKLLQAIKSKRIGKKFRERILLAVTAINECKYCSYGHSLMALKAGCTQEEILKIMKGDFEQLDSHQRIALNFAQHYTATKRNPGKKALNALFSWYSYEESYEILLLIHLIEMGNLLGNTIDAFKSRLKGKPPENGSLILEFIVFFVSFPFLWLIH
jgi:AhpD family alkylhydroperoxidase